MLRRMGVRASAFLVNDLSVAEQHNAVSLSGREERIQIQCLSFQIRDAGI